MNIKEIEQKNKLLQDGAYYVSLLLDWIEKLTNKYYSSDDVMQADDWLIRNRPKWRNGRN